MLYLSRTCAALLDGEHEFVRPLGAAYTKSTLIYGSYLIGVIFFVHFPWPRELSVWNGYPRVVPELGACRVRRTLSPAVVADIALAEAAAGPVPVLDHQIAAAHVLAQVERVAL